MMAWEMLGCAPPAPIATSCRFIDRNSPSRYGPVNSRVELMEQTAWLVAASMPRTPTEPTVAPYIASNTVPGDITFAELLAIASSVIRSSVLETTPCATSPDLTQGMEPEEYSVRDRLGVPPLVVFTTSPSRTTGHPPSPNMSMKMAWVRVSSLARASRRLARSPSAASSTAAIRRDPPLLLDRRHRDRDPRRTRLRQLRSRRPRDEADDVVVLQDTREPRRVDRRPGPQDMSVVVHPGLPVDAVGDPALRCLEVTSILSQEHKGLIEQPVGH